MSFDREWEGVGPVVATELQIVDSSGNVVIDASPTPIPSIDVTGTGVISINDPATGKELDLMVLGGSGNTPEILMSGHGTFASGSMSAVIQMDDLGDQILRIFMGRRGQDDSRAAINQWDINATRNTFRMHGYDVDFATSTLGWIFDGTAPGGIKALIGDTPETWHDVALLNGWVNRAGWDHMSYRLMPDGTVRLRGSISGGTSASGTQIGSLPAGYRPPTHDAVGGIASDNLPAAYAAANGSPRMQVQTGGNIFIYGTGAGPLFFESYSFSTLP